MFDRLQRAGPRGVTRRRGRMGLLGAAGGLAVAPVLAQAESLDPATVAAPVTVVAKAAEIGLSRLPQDVRDATQSITVLDKDLLQAQGATSLADALRNVPGVTIGGAEGGQIGNNINLNGFTARTDLFLDGMRDRGQYYRDTFALESVEVLMGPSSMLFGRGSTGGAINQVSKRPSARPSAEIDLSGGTNGFGRATVDLNGPLADGLAGRIALMDQSGATSTRRKTTVRDYGVAPSLGFGDSASTQLVVSALLQHNHDRPDYGLPPLNGRPAPTGRDTVYGYSDDRTIQDVAAAAAELKHRFDSGITVRDQLQYESVRTDARETAAQGIGVVSPRGYSPLPVAGISALPLDQLSVRLQSHDRVIRDTSLYDQLEAGGEFASGPLRHALLAGVEFGHDSYRNQAYSRTGACNGVKLPAGYTGCVTLVDPVYAGSPASPQIRGNLATGEADSAAAYLNDTVTLTPSLQLIGGLRFDRFAASIANTINRDNTPGNSSFAALNQTVDFTSVRLGLLWRPTRGQSYYASYSTSFNPSLEQLTSTTGLSRPLPPETNKAYEIGGRWNMPGDELELSAALFQITQDNARSQNADNTYTADGTIRVRGLRLGATGRLTDRWRLFAAYAHLDARIVSAIAPGTLGRAPANTPADSGALWTTYDVGESWSLGGGATYVSKRFANNTNLVSAPGYVRFDAAVAWRRPEFELRLNIFNLFDTTYYDSLVPSDGGRVTPGSGRTAMLTLALRR